MIFTGFFNLERVQIVSNKYQRLHIIKCNHSVWAKLSKPYNCENIKFENIFIWKIINEKTSKILNFNFGIILHIF